MPKVRVLSVAFGFVVAGTFALTTSQASPPPATLNPAAIRIEYMPHPRDMVQIKEGTPYTVPGGKLFVLTGLGNNAFGAATSLSVDGVQECQGFTQSVDASVVPVPLGLAIGPGKIINVTSGDPYPENARAWGYLASQ